MLKFLIHILQYCILNFRKQFRCFECCMLSIPFYHMLIMIVYHVTGSIIVESNHLCLMIKYITYFLDLYVKGIPLSFMTEKHFYRCHLKIAILIKIGTVYLHVCSNTWHKTGLHLWVFERITLLCSTVL